jgi:hypothetical protein
VRKRILGRDLESGVARRDEGFLDDEEDDCRAAGGTEETSR